MGKTAKLLRKLFVSNLKPLFNIEFHPVEILMEGNLGLVVTMQTLSSRPAGLGSKYREWTSVKESRDLSPETSPWLAGGARDGHGTAHAAMSLVWCGVMARPVSTQWSQHLNMNQNILIITPQDPTFAFNYVHMSWAYVLGIMI